MLTAEEVLVLAIGEDDVQRLKEIVDKTWGNLGENIIHAMVFFAKIHVQAARKPVIEYMETYSEGEDEYKYIKNNVVDAYPVTNIK